jgi:hypothetical protein
MTPHFSDAPLACVKRDADSPGAIFRLFTPKKIVLPVFLIGRFGRIHLPQSRVELDRSFCLPVKSEEITSCISRQIVTTFMEDRTILEDQQRNWDSAGPDARMIDIAADRGPLEARRMICQLHD